MKTHTIAAIILIAIGIVAFTYQGISYTTKEKVIDIGPIELTADNTNTFPLPPIVGALALMGGIIVLLVGKKSA